MVSWSQRKLQQYSSTKSKKVEPGRSNLVRCPIAGCCHLANLMARSHCHCRSFVKVSRRQMQLFVLLRYNATNTGEDSGQIDMKEKQLLQRGRATVSIAETLKCSLGVSHSRSLKMVQLESLSTVSYSSSIATAAVVGCVAQW